MSIRNKLYLACESFLRVPPLFIIDEIFRTSFGLGGQLFQQGKSSRDSVSKYVAEKTLIYSENVDEKSVNNEASSLLSNTSSDFEKGSSAYVDAASSESSFSYISYIADALVFAEEYIKNETRNFIEGNSDKVAEVATINELTNSTILLQMGGAGEFSTETEDLAGSLLQFGEVICSLVLFFSAVVVFMLSTENLIKLYSYFMSFLSLYIAYITTPISLPTSLSSVPFLFMNICFRTVLAAVFFLCRSWPNGYPTREQRTNNNYLVSFLDFILFLMFFVSGFMHVPPVLYVITVSVLHHSLIVSLPKLYNFLLLSWGETKRVQNEYGLSHLIQVESGRLRINTVFRLFWMTRAAYDAFYRCCDEPLSLIIRYVMTHGTETFTGVIGLTVTVAAICHQIGDFLLWLLYFGTNNEADANRFGSISTVLFFILSLQTGLTSLDPEKRLDRLMKNIVLLGTALFHALHQMVAPLLHAFRSFQAVQIRAATISCTFLCFSCLLTIYVLRWSTISTWSLAVLALAIEFKIKVIISLIISLVVYLSQLVQYPDVLERFVNVCRRILPQFVMRFFDQLYDQISHEDMVFYLKTFANVAEFLTGIFLFVNAVWIFLFESASAIRAIGMSIHAYFNIWCEAQKGYRVYCQRKTASKKIMSLADASDLQLKSRNDDVCSICYEGFESAKVTNCGHLFHAVCLRKWLYVQNTCPMCHEILYKEDVIGREIDDPIVHLENDEPAQQPQPNNDPVNLNQNNFSDSEGDDLPENNNRNNSTPLIIRPTPVEPTLNQVDNINNRREQLIGNYDGIRFYNVDGNLTGVDATDVEDNISSDAGYPVEEYEESEGDELEVIGTDSEDDDDGENGGLQAAHNRGLVVFL